MSPIDVTPLGVTSLCEVRAFLLYCWFPQLSAGSWLTACICTPGSRFVSHGSPCVLGCDFSLHMPLCQSVPYAFCLSGIPPSFWSVNSTLLPSFPPSLPPPSLSLCSYFQYQHRQNPSSSPPSSSKYMILVIARDFSQGRMWPCST